ncbi:6-hydroxypseudooxynicotine dehydrogenase complex subunit beta [Pseudovibrio axinellae]|uniref:6-hydroxypseudooxynicotine dehydrogenase complex subunit beta n=1 Tax=Pseudovibrio axinellae TaxID=989403 RepID=A0A165XC16_9HYPH|nr:xanthine dehydrogenase small subunit [Pseudovibrio axinellae]KZL17559.1 6-hydroxypseudooxynicotine dehydrogenase complex subunit beta [Pseudovibrio axinellae]SER32732.1 xanthine dehydrogenase small subunit [Pseudovibrio axinellae]
MRKAIRFLRKGKVVELDQFEPTTTLLDYLRLSERSTGTKEGCGEGDCGACTIAIGRLRNGELVYEPVNSCILLLGQIDGCELVSVEDLEGPEGLHPVQQALFELHGSQCGFCTPGFVMSLFTLYHANKPGLSRADVNEWIAGNLCRCTGYRPIVDAALEACCSGLNDAFSARAEQTREALEALHDEQDVLVGEDAGFFYAPANFQSLLDTYAEHPDATLVSGSTDVGLWITKHLRDLPKIIYLGRVIGLGTCYEDEQGIRLGASASYAVAEEFLKTIDPDLDVVMSRIGSKQVRASGTVGGNIANGSPIGDMPPMLIALGAEIELQSNRGRRNLPLEHFFIDYGKQDIAENEVLTSISVPRLKSGEHFRAYKISKRFDQDISAVMAAFCLTVKDGVVEHARMAFGGMAGVPKRAGGAEVAIVGARLDEPDSWVHALSALERDFSPLTDMRASGAYRQKVACSLLEKALLELSDQSAASMRVHGQRAPVFGDAHVN